MVIKLPLPQKVYKFMEPKYLMELKKNKIFFINHLNNYPEEKLGSEVGDDNEGTLTTRFEINDYTFNNEKSENPAFEKAFHSMQRGIHIGENANNISIKDVTIQQDINDNNYFVYCSCLEYDPKLKKDFSGGTNTTLIINDFKNFLLCINREMIRQGIRPVAFGACEYVSKRESVFTQFDSEFLTHLPFLIKEDRYRYQKEFRVLWKNNNNELIKEPIFLYCPEALKYCSFEF